jgi:hypothetical protein
MLARNATLIIFAVSILTSCAQSSLRTEAEKLGSGKVLLSTSAANSLTVTSPILPNDKICVRLGPDTAYNSSEKAMISVFGDVKSAGVGETETELVGRSIAVVFMRDAIYNLCIANMNGTISDEFYAETLEKFYMKGFDVLNEEIKNETITIIEKSALGQPVNIGDLGEKSGEGRSSSSSHKKSIGCDTLTLPMRNYFDRFKKSKEYDDKAAYDCRNMLSNNFKPKLIK